MNIRAMIAAVALVAAFVSAWVVQGWRFEAKEAHRLEAEREHERANARTADKASEAHEEVKAEIQTQIQVVYRDVEKIVEKPVYRDTVCFDPDGLRALRSALGDRAAASQPPPAVR